MGVYKQTPINVGFRYFLPPQIKSEYISDNCMGFGWGIVSTLDKENGKGKEQ